MKCVICDGADGAAEMTDGRFSAVLCDRCRPLTVALFHVHRSLETAVEEVRKAMAMAMPEANVDTYMRPPGPWEANQPQARQWSPVVTKLIEFSKAHITAVKTMMLTAGLPVAPVTIVTVGPTGALKERVLLGETSADDRHQALMEAVKDDQAQAVLFFGDINIRNLQLQIEAEALHCVIEAPGEYVVVMAKYTRNPLRFGETEIVPQRDGGWIRGNPFNKTTKH